MLQAATHQKESGTAALYVLNMGRPVRIQTLAESMIRMKGLVPGQDIKIAHTGLRPGDKMHEALTYQHEELDETDIECVRAVRKLPKIGQGFELALESLLKAASERDPARAVYQLNAMISNYATKETEHQVASTA